MIGRMSIQLKSAASQAEVRDNIRRFVDALESGHERCTRLADQSTHWVFDEDSGQFGPSRFVGFHGMTPGLYGQALAHATDLPAFDGARTRASLARLLGDFENDALLSRLLALRLVRRGVDLSPEDFDTARWSFTRLDACTGYAALACNPSFYDGEAALAELDEVSWSCPRGEPLQAGDRVVVWQTKDERGRRGIIGIGEVTRGVVDEASLPAEERFWRMPGQLSPERYAPRVRIKPMRSRGVPIWDDEENRWLRDLAVARARGGTRFSLRPEEWHLARAIAEESAAPGRESPYSSATGSPSARSARAPNGGATPYVGDQPFIFISYSRKDSEAVLPFVRAMAERGVRVWWDEGLHAGEKFGERLQRQVERCAGIAVFLSENSVASKAQNWVLEETKLAAEHDRAVIPIRLDATPMPLEWRTLVAHRQIVDASGPDRQSLVRALFDRAAALGATAAATRPTDLPARVSPEQAPPAPATSAGGMPAWAAHCLELLQSLQQIREQWWRRVKQPEDEHAVPDLESRLLTLPLAVDAPEIDRQLHALLSRGTLLDSAAAGFASRIRDARMLVSRVPDCEPSAAGRGYEAFFLVHLLNLGSILRLYAEAHEAPEAEVRRYFQRAEQIASAEPAKSSPPQHLLELDWMLQLAIQGLELEIQLAHDPPRPEEISSARHRGHLAYSPKWRARLEAADELGRQLPLLVRSEVSSPDNGAPISFPGLLELSRQTAYCQWLQVACELLRTPKRPLGELLDAHKPGASMPQALVQSATASALVARGAARVLATLRATDPDFHFMKEPAFPQVLGACVAPAAHCASRDEAWHPPACCLPPLALLRLIPVESTMRELRCWTPHTLASLIIAASETGLSASELGTARNTLDVLLRLCIHHGAHRPGSWRVVESLENTPTRTALWVCLLHALVDRTSAPGDALVVATEADPQEAAIEEGLRLHERIFGRINARALRKHAARAITSTLRFRTIGWEKFDHESKAPQRLAERIQAFGTGP